jgi:hypothetical protein
MDKNVGIEDLGTRENFYCSQYFQVLNFVFFIENMNN